MAAVVGGFEFSNVSNIDARDDVSCVIKAITTEFDAAALVPLVVFSPPAVLFADPDDPVDEPPPEEPPPDDPVLPPEATPVPPEDKPLPPEDKPEPPEDPELVNPFEAFCAPGPFCALACPFCAFELFIIWLIIDIMGIIIDIIIMGIIIDIMSGDDDDGLLAGAV